MPRRNLLPGRLQVILQTFEDFARFLDQDLFAPRRFAANNLDSRLWHSECFRKLPDYIMICRAIRRYGGSPHTQHAIKHTLQLVTRCTRYNLYSNEQVGIRKLATHTAKGRRESRNIVPACNRMIANIGEISSPPSDGMIFRNGRNTGSASELIIATIG